MIEILHPSLPVAKRQKRSNSPTHWLCQEDDETSSLCGLDSCNDFLEEIGEYEQVSVEREEQLLDHVLALYENYEEDSLFQQSKIRLQMSSSISGEKTEALLKNLKDEKAKCSILKVLTLLLQTESRLKGSNHVERMDLIKRVKTILSVAGNKSTKRLKKFFVQFFTFRQETLFPPSSIFVPKRCFLDSGKSDCLVKIDEAQLIRRTNALTSLLEEASRKVMQHRLEQENYSNEEEQDWDNMSEIWHAWLQFSPRSFDQLAIWEESLRDGIKVDSLLWNLAFYLSQWAS
mmetsp:Transcript_19263/g.28502  ORF Transcript_19263/g.28502 Transcript_19263/m.28502 type:complete len:289 (+) Transcript_19263:156-1022(+)